MYGSFALADAVLGTDILSNDKTDAEKVTEAYFFSLCMNNYYFSMNYTQTFFSVTNWAAQQDLLNESLEATYVPSMTVVQDNGKINWKTGEGYPKPPNWKNDWEWRYPESERSGVKPRWFDSSGGEWRYHFPDEHHPIGHWDHNFWLTWNDEWVNIYIKGGE